MIYALFGIPLTILLYQSVGDIINAFFAFLIRRVKRRTGNLTRVRNIELGMLDGILITIYFGVGAATFSTLENWSYLDSLYYCFITLSTIGFGDYVALQKHNHHMSHTAYLALWVTFIMLGLAVISSGLNLFIRFTMEITTTDQSKKEIDKTPSKMVKDLSQDGNQTRQSSIKTNTTIVHDTSENNSIGTPPLENKQEKKKLIHNCDHVEPLLNNTPCENNGHRQDNNNENNKNIILTNGNNSNAKRVRIADSDVVVMTEVTTSSESDHNNYQQYHF